MFQEIADYLQLLEEQRAVFLRQLDGLPVEALEWTPLPDDTSSIAALIHHCASTLRWFAVEELTGQPAPRQDRAADFGPHGQDAASLASLINAAFDDATSALESFAPALLGQARPVTIEHRFKGTVHNGRFILNHALRHQGEHIGHISLTRQLWEAQHR
jgi:hypothetical protein